MTETQHDEGPIFSVAGLDVSYESAEALNDVGFELPRQSVLALLGVNGAGKSSLARACAGLIPIRRGHVRLDGVDITGWPAARVRRAGLVYLPEGRGIFPDLSVRENLRLSVCLLDRHDRQASTDRVMDIFPVLAERQSQLAGTLSGGEQQMLSLVRIIVGRPKVVIIDEPSLGLAPLIVDSVFENLRSIRDLGISMVVIEQFVDRALALADECVILEKGTVTWSGSASEAQPRVADSYLGVSEPGIA